MKHANLWTLAAVSIALAACTQMAGPPAGTYGNPEPSVSPADTLMVDTTTGIPPSMTGDTAMAPSTMPGDTPFVSR
ncbi:hypothetical protein BH23GEM4_BH23GEM4_09270 [soil metagenome]